MSHRHFCDFAGHPWECSNPNCECFDHGVSMEHGDHSRCRVELRPCPEHEDEAARSIAEAKSSKPEPFSIQKWLERPRCNCGCGETEPSRLVGWCVRCTHSYEKYSPEIEDRHFAFHCPGAPRELRQSARERLAKHKTGR
jgi:hypothetical protein